MVVYAQIMKENTPQKNSIGIYKNAGYVASLHVPILRNKMVSQRERIDILQKFVEACYKRRMSQEDFGLKP